LPIANLTNEEATEKGKILDQTHDRTAVMTIHDNRIPTTGTRTPVINNGRYLTNEFRMTWNPWRHN